MLANRVSCQSAQECRWSLGNEETVLHHISTCVLMSRHWCMLDSFQGIPF